MWKSAHQEFASVSLKTKRGYLPTFSPDDLLLIYYQWFPRKAFNNGFFTEYIAIINTLSYGKLPQELNLFNSKEGYLPTFSYDLVSLFSCVP